MIVPLDHDTEPDVIADAKLQARHFTRIFIRKRTEE